MSSKTLGFVYTGLVMEMLHIMQSRLEHMDIPKDAAARIMGNFIPVLLNFDYINNVFKCQQRCTILETPLRFRFEDCISESEDFAMSASSFNTLYELMVMGLKRQVVMASSIGELVVATRRNFAKVDKLTQNPVALASLGFLAKQFIAAYQNLPSAHSVALQFSLHQFLQHHRSQVSIFIQDGQQLLDGSFIISLAGPVPANANIPGTLKAYDEDTGELVLTDHNYFKLPMYMSCSSHQMAARLSFNVNAYQNQYPPFPEMSQVKKAVTNMQSQTDPLELASLSENCETRHKLQAALEVLGDDADKLAEIIASEQREVALKIFSENQAEKTDGLQPNPAKQFKPLHLPHNNLDCVQLSPDIEVRPPELSKQIKDHVVLRDSVVRLREMLSQGHVDKMAASKENSTYRIAKSLPKRVYDPLREPPKLILQPSESLISLAEKLQYLDGIDATWTSADTASYFSEESSSTPLHQKLRQLPAVSPNLQTEKHPAVTMDVTYSLSHTLQNLQRNSAST